MMERVHEGLAQLPELVRVRATAEAAEWALMLRVADDGAAAAAHLPRAARGLEAASVAMEIGVATGWSEAQVHTRLGAARRVRDHAPCTWLAFTRGRIDAARIMAIATTVAKLESPEALMGLDQSVVSYAESHTVGELRAWLRRFIARTEPHLAAQRAERERADRYIEVTHTDDAMAYFTAYIPSVAAAAIKDRLTKAAKQMHGDERTIAQRGADLAMSWLTNADSTTTAIGADIAVVVPAEVLAGASDDVAIAQDGSWLTPASWLLDYAHPDTIFWHRLLHDPASGLLDHTYLGRFCPDHLATAICFRDGVCRAPGCLRPARECDQDHLEAWPQGPTSGPNLGPLCRRHHRLKTHGYLTWILPSKRHAPVQPVAHAPPPQQPSATNDRIARTINAYNTKKLGQTEPRGP